MSMPPIGTAHFLFHDLIIRHSGTRLLLHVLLRVRIASISGLGFVFFQLPPPLESG